MGLSLADGETKVRSYTRHVGDTTRLPQADLRLALNDAYRLMRSWLREVAPKFYLLTSSDQVVAAGGTVTLTTVSAIIETPHRVERQLSDGSYRPMELADPGDPNRHQVGDYTWREENGLLLFGPDTSFEGTVRVLYHVTVADISSGSFAVPVQLEMPLVFTACGLVALMDSEGAEGKASWDAVAAGLLKTAEPQLRKSGAHQQRAGLQRVKGY